MHKLEYNYNDWYKTTILQNAVLNYTCMTQMSQLISFINACLSVATGYDTLCLNFFTHPTGFHEGFLFFFQCPHISWKLSFCRISLKVYRFHKSCVPFVEVASCNTDVFFHISANICNFGLVNYIGCQALVVQWAFISFPAITPFLAVGFIFFSRRWRLWLEILLFMF